MRKTFLYFVDWFVHDDIKKPDSTSLELLRKSRISAAIGIFIIPTVLAVFTARIIVEGVNHPSLYLLLVPPFIALWGLFYMRNTGDYRPAGALLLLFSLLIVPYRIYITGGLTSAAASWVLLAPAVGIALFGTRVALFCAAFELITLGGVAYLENLGQVPALTATPLVQFVVLALILMVVTLILYAYESERRTFIKIAKETEERETVNTIVATLNHELNTPLAILEANLALLKSDDPRRTDRTRKAFRRIQKIVAQIDALQGKDLQKDHYHLTTETQKPAEIYKIHE